MSSRGAGYDMGLLNALGRRFYARRRARLRAIMRGSRRLRMAGDLGKVQSAREELTVTPVGVACGPLPRWLDLDPEVIERSIRQTLLIRLGMEGLIEAMLLSSAFSGRRISYPLPASWRTVLRKHGFQVAGLRSSILMLGYALAHWANGLRVFGRQAGAFFRPRYRSEVEIRREPYAYFDALPATCLPSPGIEGAGRDGILGWYARWKGRPTAVKSLSHSIPDGSARSAAGLRVVFVRSPLPALTDPVGFLRFLIFGMRAAGLSLVQLSFGRWQPALIFADALWACYARHVEPTLLARDYLFHNSNWIKRPLWTHVAQARGSRVIFYPYSCNSEKIGPSGTRQDVPFGWAAMDWPLMLAWDEHHERFFRRAAGDRGQVMVTGPVDFLSAGTSRLQVDVDNGIAVFDVQPFRESIYRRFGIEFDYYVPQVAKQFIRDLSAAAHGTHCTLLLKRKRDVGRRLHPLYSRELARSLNAPLWAEVPPETLAIDLIRSSRGVVSMPFTSTAVLARHLGKPSVYYDASRQISRDDAGGHGVPILQSPEELRDWMMSLCPSPAR